MLKFEKLTRANLRKLKANDSLTEHGIVFDRLSNGDGRFSVNVMVDGQRIHRVIGKESDGTTRTQAEEFIQKIKQDARTGRLNLPKGRKLALSFHEAAQHYLEKQMIASARNLTSKKCHLRWHLVPFFNHTPLNKITTFDIEKYKKLREEANAKPTTINRELAVLSHLFTKAVEWEWIDKKPAVIKRYKEEQCRITYLTVDQINRLLEAAKKDSNPRVYLFILIGLETAMRRMEILSIKISDIDLDQRMIYIPHAKAGARQQPITSHLAQFLKEYLEGRLKEEWLFPAESQSGHATTIEKPFRRVVAAAGLDPYQVIRHTLRHTAITHLVQSGIDLPTVKRISGHKTLKMVERYSHQNGSHINAAMDRLEERYRGNK